MAEGVDAHVVLQHVHMRFGNRTVFQNLSCAFPRGKVTVILGGSGAGKSTVLRLVGGLIRPQAGQVVVIGRDVTQLAEGQLYEVRRQLGMMFQGGALLDSLTVFDNLAFPLREHTQLSEAEIAAEVHARLESVGLRDVDALLPGQLSGGMIKRVALARAIMMKPLVLLCDEPFSGLDPISTKRIEQLLLRINREFGITILLVSHNITSTLRMADQVVLLLDAQVVTGPPAELRRSADPRVIEFLTEEMPEPLAS